LFYAILGLFLQTKGGLRNKKVEGGKEFEGVRYCV
jgi:hypothetical protein